MARLSLVAVALLAMAALVWGGLSSEDPEVVEGLARSTVAPEAAGGTGQGRFSATATVDVPSRPEGSDPIEVRLVLQAPASVVRVRGSVDPGSGVHTGLGLHAEGQDGTKLRSSPMLDADGSFTFLVDPAAIAGPQFTLTSWTGHRVAGPFSVSGDAMDLGEIQFAGRPGQEVTTIFRTDATVK